jgi:hypothetical protein
MKRREFITILGGAVVALPRAARAQQNERMRRVGVLMSTRVSDPEGKARLAAFQEGLQALGWTDGRNMRVDVRWSEGEPKTFANMRQSWSRSRPRSSWLRVVRSWDRCSRSPAACRSCSRRLPIRSPQALSKA